MQQPAEGAAKPDRSAEPLLRKMLAQAGQADKVHYTIGVYNRSVPGATFETDGSIDVWLKRPSMFMIERYGYFGDGRRVVSDGKIVLSDPLTTQGPVTLSDAQKVLTESDETLRLRGYASSVLLYLLAGEAGFDRLIPADGFIVEGPKEGNTASIVFGNKTLGTVLLRYDASDPRMRLLGAEYNSDGGWTGPPKDMAAFVRSTRVLEKVIRSDVDPKMADRLFDTTPPKGITLVDRRGKPAPANPPTPTRPPRPGEDEDQEGGQ